MKEKGPANWLISSKITHVNKDHIVDEYCYYLNLWTQLQPPDSTWGIKKPCDTPIPEGIQMPKTWEPQKQKDYDGIDSK